MYVCIQHDTGITANLVFWPSRPDEIMRYASSSPSLPFPSTAEEISTVLAGLAYPALLSAGGVHRGRLHHVQNRVSLILSDTCTMAISVS